MPTQIEKLQAYANHLLDAFIELREKYALLEPMLISEMVQKERGSGRQARGFEILKYSLFLSCSQDIAKLVMDADGRTPSLSNLVRFLADEDIRIALRNAFSEWRVHVSEEEVDPAIFAALRRMEEQEVAERIKEFDAHYCEAMTLWAKLSTNPVIKGFRTIRDKVSAHTEVRFRVDQYQRIDIGSLGIKWGDLGIMIDDMQKLVGLMTLLIRNTSFLWDTLDSHLSQASQGFWGLPVGAS